MSKVLTIENAEITTAAVELKTLTIKGRQVTLSLFRQLQEEKLIDENGKFVGNPWGFVNYQCEDNSERNVVWQKGKELRRTKIPDPRNYKTKYKRNAPWYIGEENINFITFLCAVIVSYGRGEACRVKEGGNWLFRADFINSKIFDNTLTRYDSAVFDRTYDGSEFKDFVGKVLYGAETWKGTHNVVREKIENEILEGLGIGDCITLMTTTLDELSILYDEHTKRWDEINSLPQLFIAA